MFYDVGSVTNRNIQLLYEYRILREPSDNLSAICRDSTPQETSTLSWSISNREIEGYEQVYEATLDEITPQDNCVPFLEFHPEDDVDWKWIADFIDVEVDSGVVKIYSTTDYLTSIPMSVYWCYSLRHIDSMLTDILKDLDKLVKEYDKLEDEIRNFKDTGRYLKRPEGLIPNLVKIQNTAEGSDLVDSLYRIMTAESNRLFVNMTQDNLNHMEHIFNETVEFRFLNQDHYVLDDFTVQVMLISGSGDLVLKNIRGQVLVTRWRGTVTVIDCPEVHLTAVRSGGICRLKKLQISKGSTVYLENQVHVIDDLAMFADSVCRHWRANVKSLSYVGPGCTYWCCAQVSVPGRVQLAEYTDASNTVFDFNLHDIVGSFISDFDDIMLVGFKNLTPRLGNSDAEPQPGMYVSYWKATYSSYVPGGDTPGDGGMSEITVDNLKCWVWMPNNHDNVGLILCVPGVQAGEEEATNLFGAWKAVTIVRPRAACLFLQRPSAGALPSKDAILQTIQSLQTTYNLGSNLWYFGFSAGANAYSTVSTWTTFKGAVLIDCDDSSAANFTTVGLEKLMVVQGAMHIGSAYEKYRNVVPEFVMYDYNGEHTHASVNFWTPSDSEATYQTIAGGYYESIPDNPPNGLVWLCGGQALPDGGDAPDLSKYTVFPEYLQTVISDAYMGILPSDVQNIDQNQGLAIMYGISLYEYGDNQVGWAYAKMFRTYLMAGCKSATGTFSHNLNEEAALVMHPTNPADPWGFENLYTVSGLISKCKTTGSTEGMQNFYNMIKNPGVYGITDDVLTTICSYGSTGNNSNTGCPNDGQFHYDFPGKSGIVDKCIYAYDSTSELVTAGTHRITYYCSYYARDRWNSGNQNPNL